MSFRSPISAPRFEDGGVEDPGDVLLLLLLPLLLLEVRKGC